MWTFATPECVEGKLGTDWAVLVVAMKTVCMAHYRWRLGSCKVRFVWTLRPRVGCSKDDPRDDNKVDTAIHCTRPSFLASVISELEAHRLLRGTYSAGTRRPGRSNWTFSCGRKTKAMLVFKLLLSIFFFNSNINYIIKDNMHTKMRGSLNQSRHEQHTSEADLRVIRRVELPGANWLKACRWRWNLGSNLSSES